MCVFLLEASYYLRLIIETEPTLAEAMQNIFSACDTENDGVVLTSKLIEYISPFMACNRCVYNALDIHNSGWWY